MISSKQIIKSYKQTPLYLVAISTGVMAVQGFGESGLELGACLGMKNIGNPCAGEPQARFDEGRLMNEQVFGT